VSSRVDLNINHEAHEVHEVFFNDLKNNISSVRLNKFLKIFALFLLKLSSLNQLIKFQIEKYIITILELTCFRLKNCKSKIFVVFVTFVVKNYYAFLFERQEAVARPKGEYYGLCGFIILFSFFYCGL